MVDRYGHDAQSPSAIPKRGWNDIAKRSFKRTMADNVGLVSAGVAFYGFFASLSMAGLIVLSYGLFTDPRSAIAQMQALTAVLPSDVASVIRQQLLTVIESSAKTKGLGVAVAALVAIYGGTNGAAATIVALNIAYEEKEKRGLVHFYLLAISMTLGALLVALCALAGTTALAYLQHLVPTASGALVIAGKIIGSLALIPLAAGVAATLYRFGPSRQDARWKWITPGSIFTAVAWLVLTIAFGFYVSHLTSYKASYGSLAAVVAMLTWMYFVAYAFVFGAEINSEIEHQTAWDSTTGKPEPMGQRGAWAADNVARDDTIQDRPEEKREGAKLTDAAPAVAEEKG